MSGDLLAVGRLIKNRLLEKVPGLLAVHTMAGRDDRLKQQLVRLPAVLVAPGGHDVPQGDGAVIGHGRSQIINQHWLVILAVSTASQRDNEDLLSLAGPLLHDVNAALMGWSPTGSAMAAFRMATPPEPFFIDDVFLYPLVFSTRNPLSAG